MASAAVGTVTHGQLGQSSYALGSQVKQKWPRGVVSRYIKKSKNLRPCIHCAESSKRGGRRAGDGVFNWLSLVLVYLQEQWKRGDDLHCAASEGRLDQVLMLLDSDKSASGSILESVDEEGRTALHWACDRGHAEMVGYTHHHTLVFRPTISLFFP